MRPSRQHPGHYSSAAERQRHSVGSPCFPQGLAPAGHTGASDWKLEALAPLPAFLSSHDDLCLGDPQCHSVGVLDAVYGPAGSDGGSTARRGLGSLTPTLPQFAGQRLGPPQIPSGLRFADGAGQRQLSSHSFTGLQQMNSFSGPEVFSASETCSPVERPQISFAELADMLSECSSACSRGGLCLGVACVDAVSICDDEHCVQSGRAITSEDASAAAALTSFGGVDPFQLSQLHGLDGSQFAQRSCLVYCDLSSEQAAKSSPELKTNYEHLYSAHNPHQPSCDLDFCPIDDPSFYQQCHLPHASPMPQNLFADIDADHMLNDEAAWAECGVKLPTSDAMIEHFWTMHGLRLPTPTGDALPLHDGISGLGSPPPSAAEHFPRNTATLTGGSSASYPKRLDELEQMTAQPMSRTPSQSSLSSAGSSSSAPPAPAPPASLPNVQNSLASLDKIHCCQWCSVPGGLPCGETFQTAAHLHGHVHTAHTYQVKKDEHGQFACLWLGCDRVSGRDKEGFPQRSKLERHMQVHTGNRPFTCTSCGISFSGKQALDQHSLIHKNEKPFVCVVCAKAFRQQSALTMHIRTHTGEKPLKCEICHQAFGESSNLAKHRRTHNPTGSYVCDVEGCGRRFHRRDQLRRHSSVHTKKKTRINSSPKTSSESDASVLPVPQIRKSFAGIVKKK